MSTSKTGKHGHAKVHLVAIDIFTGKKLEDLCPSTHNMDVPNVLRTEYQFVSFLPPPDTGVFAKYNAIQLYTEDGFLHLVTADGTEKNDVRLPEGEVGAKIQEFEESGTDCIVTIISAMNEELAIAVKEAPK